MLAGFALLTGVLFSMTVYGSTESETEEKQSDSDILVVYFSRTGELYNVGHEKLNPEKNLIPVH